MMAVTAGHRLINNLIGREVDGREGVVKVTWTNLVEWNRLTFICMRDDGASKSV